MTDRTAWQSVLMTIISAALTAGAWWYHRQVVQVPSNHATRERWEQVKELYPLSPELTEAPKLSGEMIEGVVRANPFSPQRRSVPPTASGGAGAAGSAPEAPPPQFVYKGRVDLGTRHRAILEDATAHKTYFLEVGQDVAGFKILDITETEVILSNPQTHEDIRVSARASSTVPSRSPQRAATPAAPPGVSSSSSSSSPTSSPHHP